MRKRELDRLRAELFEEKAREQRHKARAEALGEALRELWKDPSLRLARLKVQRRFNLLLACFDEREGL